METTARYCSVLNINLRVDFIHRGEFGEVSGHRVLNLCTGRSWRHFRGCQCCSRQNGSADSTCLANNFQAAGTLQLELKALCDAMFCDVNPIPVKTALNLMGWKAGALRLPLYETSESNLAHIRQTPKDYNLLSQ